MKALVLNGRVVDRSNSEFDVAPSFTWVDCGDDVNVGWSYDGETFTDEDTIDEEELSAQERVKRDNFLSDSDWTQLPDSQLTDAKKTEWATYRQSLRDVPSQSSFPTTITWPTKP
jgi:hypothetical protein